MGKKMVKKKRIKIFSLLLLFLIVAIFFFAIYFYVNSNIQNIIIRGTSYLKDDYILELAEIKDYPSFVLTSKSKIKERIEKSSYVSKVIVNKKLFNIIDIRVVEKKVIFIRSVEKKLVLEDGEEVDFDEMIFDVRAPRLLNYVPDKKYKQLIKAMKTLDDSIFGKMSEMEYSPNEYDKDRFLIYMDDGNIVYLTLTKFKAINYYNEVVPQLEGRKGILYLDSGNHFQIME